MERLEIECRRIAKELEVVGPAGGIGSPQIFTLKWQTLNLDHQSAILKSILESIQVDKILEKGISFNPARFRPAWKF